mmetsp:Transcript_1109/g.1687  ORF Transcript_1109/g.1687 Transcript_1109/m.1687 type:complete len:396 (+) Transcript_1109:175-1362(+)|eukprot:CAMPEP_0184545878 /NCGR_PEP_ID=MMETSP0199_2-20130426/4600_1 /TAXON_ID=1112570 /ORGANISM="Thraustochytrium sp., Strain LLF1b" /LENGTH=395 /DNA_ID=CAMNT_0026940227 /DNA_START=81 /DNA_END=1268 /DNA_ORIENTATION=-
MAATGLNVDFTRTAGQAFAQEKPDTIRTPEEERLYQPLKRMMFNKRVTPVIMQNINGPCPLLAVANALLLRGRIDVDGQQNDIHIEKVVDLVANFALEYATDDMSPVVAIPAMKFGVAVDLRFNAINSFVMDNYVALFKMLKIRLFHGWVPDRSNRKLRKALGSFTYDEAMNKIVEAEQKESRGTISYQVKRTDAAQTGEELDDEELDDEDDDEVEVVHAEAARQSLSRDDRKAATKADLMRKFLLEDSASQMTEYGLATLKEKIKEKEVCVLFRNNHFLTLYKVDGHVYSLVTDEGYRFNRQVAWERLDHVNGSNPYVSPIFGDPEKYTGGKNLGPSYDVETAARKQLKTSKSKMEALNGLPGDEKSSVSSSSKSGSSRMLSLFRRSKTRTTVS